MSAIHEYQYRQQRRREEYLNRIQGNVIRFSSSYKDVLKDMQSQGLDSLVPVEFRLIVDKLTRLESMISNSPEKARDMSTALGDEVYGLRRLARNLQYHVNRQDRILKQEAAHFNSQEQNRIEMQRSRELRETLNQEEQVESARKQKMNDLWYQLRGEFTDPVIRDFAFEDLEKLHSQYKSLSENELQHRVEQIKNLANQQATVWKEQQLKNSQRETQLEILEVQQQQVKNDFNENPKKLQEVLDSLKKSRDFLIQGGEFEPNEFQNKLSEQIQQADEAVTDERCRKLTVNGIINSLKQQGFTLTKAPELIRIGERDEVVIEAKRLSGRQSQFRVGLDGAFSYKFEHYEGMACKDDIEEILPKLQEVYGIELSNKKVIWENPDRNLKSARSMDTPQERNRDN